MPTIAEFLVTAPWAEGLSSTHLEQLADGATDQQHTAGGYLFREGDSADTFYVVRRGRVGLEVFAPPGGAITVQTVSDGEILGWSWLFPPHRCAFDARVLEPTQIIAFDGATLRRKAEDDHELGYQLMKRMAKVFTNRLAATRMQLVDVYGKPHA